MSTDYSKKLSKSRLSSHYLIGWVRNTSHKVREKCKADIYIYKRLLWEAWKHD